MFNKKLSYAKCSGKYLSKDGNIITSPTCALYSQLPYKTEEKYKPCYYKGIRLFTSTREYEWVGKDVDEFYITSTAIENPYINCDNYDLLDIENNMVIDGQRQYKRLHLRRKTNENNTSI